MQQVFRMMVLYLAAFKHVCSLERENRTLTFSPGLYSSHAFFLGRTGISQHKKPSKHHLYWFAFSAMISGVIMMVVLICYCCHKNVRKHRPQEYSQYWRTEPDIHSLEVFTMDTHVSNIFDRTLNRKYRARIIIARI